MTRILVMIPSGEVYDHDCVRWYDHWDIQQFLNHYHNIGDAFVYDSSLKMLRYSDLEVMEIREFIPSEVDRYNNEFDYAFLRGSNYIHGEFEWPEATERVLSKLKIPVIAFGVGAQAPVHGKLCLPNESKRIWRLIAERSATLGVRGDYTAEVLWNLGIRNTRIVGCPTAFRSLDPGLRIDLPPLDRVKRIGITMRREVSPIYARSVETYLTTHRDLVKDLARRFDATLMMQGEVEEKALLWGDDSQKAAAWEELHHNEWLSQWFFDPEIEELYRSRLFYSDVVSDYEDLVRTKDMVLGYRLHGNLMALSNGIPSVYFTYDSRTAEFAQAFNIPCHDVFSGKPFVLEDYWDQALFERFNRAYYHRYREMREFLEENRIPHRLPAIDAAVSARRVPQLKVA